MPTSSHFLPRNRVAILSFFASAMVSRLRASGIHPRPFFWILLLVLTPALRSQIAPQGLTCEYLTQPLAIETTAPRLSWQINDPRHGVSQTAYEILVASDPSLLTPDLADLWHSGKVPSDQSVNIPYRGATLRSGQRCYWTVRYWDQSHQPSPYATPSAWEMGIITPTDWTAELIRMKDQPAFTNDAVQKWMNYIIEYKKKKSGPQSAESFINSTLKPAPYFRREFDLLASPEKAKLLVAALGYQELYINGQRVGDRVLDPAFQDYDHQIYYVAYDVTQYLKKGPNVIAAILGNGWYNQQGQFWGRPPATFTTFEKTLGHKGLIVQMDVTGADRSTTRITSDSKWKTSYGPLLRDQLFIGEVYDARQEMPGWDCPGFDDSAWKNVEAIPAPTSRLTAMQIPPERPIREVPAISITEPTPGIYVADLGETLCGWPKITVQAPAGTMIMVRPSPYIRNQPQFMNDDLLPYEQADLDGRSLVNMIGGELRSRIPDDEKSPTHIHNGDLYVTSGRGPETFQRRFSYVGFRYIELIGLPSKPSIEDIRGVEVRSDLPMTASFACSDDNVNELYDSFARTLLYCTHGLVNDNSDAEKNSFRVHQAMAGDFLAYAYNSPAFWQKGVRDIQLQTHPSGPTQGLPPVKAPSPPYFRTRGNTAAINPITDTLAEATRALLFNADHATAADHYPYMIQFIDLIGPRLTDPRPLDQFDPATDRLKLIVQGDWLDVCKTGKRPSGGVGVNSDPDMVYRSWFVTLLNQVIQTATTLGHSQDIAPLTALRVKIAATINDQSYDPRLKTYGNQAENIMALRANIVPSSDIPAVAHDLNKIIMHDWDGHLSVGYLGVRHICTALSDYGYADTAHHLWTINTWPSWRWLYENGYDVANSYWNDFDQPGVLPNKRFIQSEKPVAAVWCYESLAGIRPDWQYPGFKHIHFRPQIPTHMQWAKATVQSLYGEILSHWQRDDTALTYRVKIPANTTGTVHVPLLAHRKVTATPPLAPQDTPPPSAATAYDQDYATYTLPSGEYLFRSE